MARNPTGEGGTGVLKARSSSPSAAEIAPLVARRFEALVQREQLDLDRLSRLSGIRQPLLGAIVRGEVEPSVDLLWKIANALGVQIGALLSPGPAPDFELVRAGESRRFSSRDGSFISRPLSPFAASSPVEFYVIALEAGAEQQFHAHAPRTTENIVVHSGSVEIRIGREPPHRLEPGDSIYFQADVPHSYRNVGTDEAQLYLVMIYRSLPGI
ncbi:XRE family transcriptional regulator [Sandaracinobacter sp. RS1-74]|nr:XRE family transcriptional regulator [Sandaracinobacteroides sayramensis]